MRFSGLLVISVLALLVAAPAGGRLLDVGELPDAAGDGAPDITRLRVGSSATAVTFIVDLANQTKLEENQLVVIFIDSDLNQETGSNGVDTLLAMVAGEEVGLFRWNGTQFALSESQTAYGYHFGGFRLAIARSELALTTGTLRFFAVTFPVESGDFSPDSTFAEYTLANDPLTLQIARFTAAKTVVAGKRYTATLQARRSDLAELSSAGEVVCWPSWCEDGQDDGDLPGRSSDLLGGRAEDGEGKDVEGDGDPDSRRRARHADGVDQGQVAVARQAVTGRGMRHRAVCRARVRAGSGPQPDQGGRSRWRQHGAPDITGVTVANDLSGTILFVVEVANRTGFAANDDILIYIDSDRSALTGYADRGGGADYLLGIDAATQQPELGRRPGPGSSLPPGRHCA